MKKLPSFNQWKQIFKVLKKREKVTLLIFLAVAIVSFGVFATSFYLNNTKTVAATGRIYKEGVIGQPRFINPIYGETNDIDRTLIDLVFSGLMTYDKQGNIVKDLADSYEISEDGKIYDFKLKDKIFWHDSKPFTADDIIFTIKTIQNSDYKSALRANWIDVELQKISDKSVRFILKTPYNSFLENLTVKIIPKHIWENISPENFILSHYNLQPIGSGSFKFLDIKQTSMGLIKNLDLASNRRYYNPSTFISGLSFLFFDNKEDLIKAANLKEIDGFTLASLDNNQLEAEKEIKQEDENFSVYRFSLPRYFAVFFNNQRSSIFSDIDIRKALAYSINKEEISKKISRETKSDVLTVDSPVLPDFFGYQKPSNIYNIDIEKAKSLLDKVGFKENGLGQREKAINKKPAFQFKSYLKVGSSGNEVIQLQSCLVRLDDNFKNLLQNETNGKYSELTGSAVTEFQKKYLPDKESTGETGQATRQKLNELCLVQQQNSQTFKFTLVTVDQPQMVEVANLIKSQWQDIGAIVDINVLSLSELKPIIKSRSYEALLYGEALGAGLDLYPFWHSSQKIDPGLNLSSYDNKDADKLIKESRETLDESEKQQKLEMLQDIIIKDSPAIFLYSPDYIYWVSKKVKGIDTEKIIDPAKRFSNITNWYIKTKRVWKWT